MVEPRSSQYVLGKLANLVSSSSKGEEGLRQYWMPDDISVECYDCSSKFTSFRRRHHCRVCGQVFCSKCCNSYIPGKHIGYNGSLRVCTFCFGFAQTYLEQGADGGLLVEGGGGRRESVSEGGSGPPTTPYNRRRHSIDEVAQLSNSHPHLASSSSSFKLNRQVSVQEDLAPPSDQDRETVVVKDPGSLARLWERVMEPGVGLPLETNRYYFRSYPGTFQGSRLVSWLCGQDTHTTTSRSQAVAIGQALLTAGFISAVSGQVVFSDNTDLYQPSQPSISLATLTEKGGLDMVTPEPSTCKEPAWLQEIADLPFGPEKRSSYSGAKNGVGGETRKWSKEIEGSDKTKTNGTTVPDGIQVDMGDLKESALFQDPEGDTRDSELLEMAYRGHEAAYLDALLRAENIPGEEVWRETLLRLAEEAVETVKPDVRNGGDDMDIRCYVKVKCVSGGVQEDCRLVSGDVCSLQLAHKDMASSIYKPRIALVANSIMFQREENKFVSLDMLAMQEEEYIKNVTGKLLDSRPNIVLVERTVSRLAQDIFLKEGVSLVLNVKYRVLERLSRLTQGTIISSVDSMLAPPKLGSCETFYSRRTAPGSSVGRTPLLLFEGCSSNLGGTLLLQGGDRRFLTRLKLVLKRLLLIKYNWKYEKSFLVNEYGSLPDLKVKDDEKYQLSISPFIKVQSDEVHVPYVVEAHDMTEEVSEEEKVTCEVEEIPRKERHPWCLAFLGHKVTDVDSRCQQDQLALFRASGWRKVLPRTPVRNYAQSKSALSTVTQLPEDHCENLSVQFSMYSAQSSVAPNYCVSPWVVNMQSYGNLDIGLGDFLDSLCFSPSYSCPNKSCTTLPLHHTRRFCHAGGAVTLHMQQLEAPIMGEDSDRLMMWKYCTSCELITNIIPVTDSTWSLSFAMFLHLLLHENQLVRRGANRPDAQCCHSLHQEHLTCFGKEDQVATFRYAGLHVWKLAIPPARLSLPAPIYSREVLLGILLDLKRAGSQMYSCVLEKLLQVKGNSFSSDQPVGSMSPTSCQDPAGLLIVEQESEHQQHRERLHQLEEKVKGEAVHGSDILVLLWLLQRDIQLAQHAWSRRLISVDREISHGVGIKGSAKKSVSSNLARSTSTELLDSLSLGSLSASKKSEGDTTTVKKLISTIMPQAEENLLPSPFPPECHLITHVGGEPVEPLDPLFVYETKPSTLISYLLSSPQYREFLVNASGTALEERVDQHFVLEPSDETTKFYCCSYYTLEFHNLRQLIFPNCQDTFISSMADCRRWEASGGKSGLLFYKTRDDRFVLKQMSRFEYQSFLEFAPHYFKYLEYCIQGDHSTLLGKIVGVFKIGFKNSATGTGMNTDFLIMENLFYNKEVTKSYDLKGSVRNRLMAEGAGGEEGQVLLDENLVRVSCESPLYINQSDKEVLNEAVRRDTAFLASHQMMDYSLLAGICSGDNELVVGIIDYIRTFTWDKKLETLVKSVKSSGVFGGQAKTPTVINPDLYKMRFTDAMNRYFSTVPD